MHLLLGSKKIIIIVPFYFCKTSTMSCEQKMPPHPRILTPWVELFFLPNAFLPSWLSSKTKGHGTQVWPQGRMRKEKREREKTAALLKKTFVTVGGKEEVWQWFPLLINTPFFGRKKGVWRPLKLRCKVGPPPPPPPPPLCKCNSRIIFRKVSRLYGLRRRPPVEGLWYYRSSSCPTFLIIPKEEKLCSSLQSRNCLQGNAEGKLWATTAKKVCRLPPPPSSLRVNSQRDL